MQIIEFIIDGCFWMDILINFLSAYYDEEHNLVTNRNLIAKNYLKGWFTIDIIAWYLFLYDYLFSFPFILFENSSNQQQMGYNKLLRLLRLGRLYRIVKLFNFLRAFKKVKKSKTYEKFLIALKMNAGIKRLIKTILTFILLVHFFACIWFFQAKFSDFPPDSW